tara:strand:+ start:718 stop:1329 length:612 start_codon:yes stop_codon:yes gene_type:complete
MSNKQKIQNIKTNIERTIQGLETKPQEFRYKRTGGFVKPNQIYSVYYTNSKRERYLTGVLETSNSKIIEKVGQKSILNRYAEVKPTIKQPYPKTTPANPNESDYIIGVINRYFARVGNDINKPLFEVSADDFNTPNNLYIYFQFEWVISGVKSDVNRVNSDTIRDLQLNYPNINQVLFPLQLWKPAKNSADDVENKLERLKTS